MNCPAFELLGARPDEIEVLLHYEERAAWKVRVGDEWFVVKADLRDGMQRREVEAPVRGGEMVDSARPIVFEIRGQDAAKLDEFYRGLFPTAGHHIRTDPAANPGSFRSALPAVGTQSSRS